MQGILASRPAEEFLVKKNPEQDMEVEKFKILAHFWLHARTQ
jgi:hypothetical protein